MQVRRLFPDSKASGYYQESVAIFAARRTRTIKSYGELWKEINSYDDSKRMTYLNHVVAEDWALDVLEMIHLVFDWEGVPMWLVIELLRHRHTARDFSLEQLSQRAIAGIKLEVEAPTPELQDLVNDYMDKVQFELQTQRAAPEQLREVLPQGVLVNLVIAANARAWQHLFYMRCSPEMGGKGGAHPKFQFLADETLKLARVVCPISFNKILPS